MSAWWVSLPEWLQMVIVTVGAFVVLLIVSSITGGGQGGFWESGQCVGPAC